MKISRCVLAVLIMLVAMMCTVTAVSADSKETEISSTNMIEQGIYPESIEQASYSLTTAASTAQTGVISVSRYYDYAFEVLEIVNEERAAEGLDPLKMNKTLLDAAMKRAGENAIVWSHTRPDGSEFNTVSDLVYAENIAYGHYTAASVMTDWMNSKGHCAAILTKEFKSIGIGVVQHNGTMYWVQLFGTGKTASDCAKPANSTVEQSVTFAPEVDGATLQPEVYISDKTLSTGQVETVKLRMKNGGSSNYAVFSNSCVTWSSSDGSARVDADGKLVGVYEGISTIKATIDGAVYTASVSVNPPEKVVTGHVDQAFTVELNSANDEAMTANRDYIDVDVVSKKAQNGRYLYTLNVTSSKPLVSQMFYIKGEISSVVMKVTATINDHSYVDVAEKEATCTEDGNTAGKKCTVCGKTTVTILPSSGHIEGTLPAVKVTCTIDGKTEGKQCRVCRTVLIAQKTIKSEGHKLKLKYNNNKKHTITCDNCSLLLTENCSFDNGVVTKEPTAEEKGTKLYTCEACGGQYTESISMREEVVSRIAGKNRYATSLKAANVLKADMGGEPFDNIIIASGKTFADALPGSYLASEKNAPILLIDKTNAATLKTYVKDNLKSGGKVYVLGGTGAIPDSWVFGMPNVKRLGGSDRYATNLLILNEAGVKSGSDILVCTGKEFADSLSASATGKPILLVGDQLNSEQKVYLSKLSGETYYMIGGTGAVSNRVMSDCDAYGAVDRVSGNNRFATSVAVANKFFGTADYAVLAYGYDFPDGLSAGPLAYNMNAPLILTATGSEMQAEAYAKSKGIKYGYVIGGPSLISDESVKTIFRMSGSSKIIIK